MGRGSIKDTSKNVIPAKAGIQKLLTSLDSRLRGSDKLTIIRGSLRPLTLILALTIVTIGWAVKVEALGPRLLWEKTMPFKIGGTKMAAISADVIVYSRDASQIILYDKQGNKRFHWGPRIDRQPMGIDISDDGNTIAYTTSWTEHYWQSKKLDIIKLGWDSRVHYCTGAGKELWNKKIEGSAFISPDASLVAVIGTRGMGGVPLTVLDSRGNILWKYNTGLLFDLRFSPDSNYILFFDDVALYLFDKYGNLFWKKLMYWNPTQSLKARNTLQHGIRKSMTSEGMLFGKVRPLYLVTAKDC